MPIEDLFEKAIENIRLIEDESLLLVELESLKKVNMIRADYVEQKGNLAVKEQKDYYSASEKEGFARLTLKRTGTINITFSEV